MMNKEYQALCGWQPQTKASLWLVVSGSSVFHPKDSLLWSDDTEWAGQDSLVIGHWQGNPVAVITSEELPEGAVESSYREVLAREGRGVACMLSHALQIIASRKEHRFCGQCGTGLQAREGEWAMACPSCTALYYPRISPCIIVLVHRGDELLLVQHHKHRRAATMHTVIAGFIEPGESAEEAVQREVLEEAGVHVKNVRYCFSQSWPFPHSLMLGFHAEYDSGELVLEEEELSAGDWFRADQLPELPPGFTISRQLIDHYLDEL